MAALVSTVAAGCPMSAAERRAEQLTDWRAAAREGDPGAALALVEEVARHGRAVGSLEDAGRWAARAAQAGDARGLAWQAMLQEASGAASAAFEGWLRLTGRAGAPAVLRELAARRMLALVDRVPLTARHAAALKAVVGVPGRPAEVGALALEQIGLRLGDDSLVTAARERLGVVRSYRRSGLLRRHPALNLARAPALLKSESPLSLVEVATPDGTVAFPEDGPGVFGAVVHLPPSEVPLVVEVSGEPAWLARLGGRETARHDRLSEALPLRGRFVLPPGPERSLELFVAHRGAAPSVRVMARPASEVDEARVPGLLGQLAALERAIAEEDAGVLGPLAETLADHVLAAPTLERAWAVDPSLPSTVARSKGRHALERALEALPGFAEARSALAVAVADAGEAPRAAALMDAGETGEHADPVAVRLLQDQGQEEPSARRAGRWVRRVPTSCEAWAALLDARWERLKVSPEAALEGLPRCFDIELRGASLLLQAFRLPAARARLEALLGRAAPGVQRASVRLMLARVALAEGALQRASEQVQAGLGEGVQREALWEMDLRARRMAGDDAGERRVLAALAATPGVSTLGRRKALDPTADLGLPLTDGHALAAEAVATRAETPDSTGASVRVLLDEHHVRVFPDGGQVHRVHRVMQLLDDGAVEELGEISLPDDAEVLVARTWKPTPGGELQPIEPEDMVEKTAISLPALEAGAVVEVAWFWVAAPDPQLEPHWSLPRFEFESDRAHVRLARFVLDTPPAARIRVATTGEVPEPLRPRPGRRVWEVRERPRVLAEPLDPRPDRRLAALRVSSDFGWELVSDAYRDVLRSRLMTTPWVERLADRVTGQPTDARKLAALHDLVLEEIQDGGGGLLGGSVSHAVASRSGERSAVLVTLCRIVGLRCELALVRPRTRGKPGDGGVVDRDDYTYPVVRAQLGDETLWLDTASRYVPYAYLPPLVQDAEVLILGDDGARVARTPAMPQREGFRKVRVVVDVAPDGSWTARGADELTGLYAMGWRHVLVDLPAEARQKTLARVAQQNLGGAVVDDVKLGGLREREAPLTLDWIARGRLAEGRDARRALSIGLSPEGLSRATVRVPSRRSPLFISRAGNLTFEITVNLPPGGRFVQPPADASVVHRLTQLQRDVEASDDGRRLTVTKRFKLSIGTVDPERYQAWIDAARAIDRADVIHLIVDLPPRQAAAQ